jgi:hypothetical protein
MRREIQSRRRHFFNKRVSLINYVSPDAKSEEMLVDESATATVKQLGDALTEMEVNGHVFGRCSLTVVLHSDDRRALDQQAAQAMKLLAVRLLYCGIFTPFSAISGNTSQYSGMYATSLVSSWMSSRCSADR